MDVRDALLDALAVLLPVECAGCGADDRALCAECRAALGPEVSARDVGGLRVWAGLRYEGVARAVLLALKRDARLDAARALAPALAAALVAGRVAAQPHPAGRVAAQPRIETPRIETPLLLVPIPGSRSAYRRRGYDPVRLLMARAGLHGIRVFAPARPHAAQKTLGVGDRERNLRGVFRLRRPVAGHRILLIDDVVTTGATLREAARVLRDAGADVVGAVVVASTPRRSAVADDALSGLSVTSEGGGTTLGRKAS
jgi:ComF family protein